MSSKPSEPTKLSSPVEQVHHMLCAFFKDDPDITVAEAINYDDMTLTISSTNVEKYKALYRRLNRTYDLGYIVLTIVLQYDADDFREYDPLIDMDTILKGNPLYDRTESKLDPLTGATYNYCIFSKQVVQYFDDMFNDLNGLRSILAQDMAQQIFNTEKVMYSTSHE